MPKRKGAAASAAKKKKFGSDAESSGDEWGSAAKVSAYLITSRVYSVTLACCLVLVKHAVWVGIRFTTSMVVVPVV